MQSLMFVPVCLCVCVCVPTCVCVCIYINIKRPVRQIHLTVRSGLVTSSHHEEGVYTSLHMQTVPECWENLWPASTHISLSIISAAG